MSAALTASALSHSRLAQDLLVRALHTFAAIPPAERGAALFAIDAFLAAPAAANYLAAVRALVAVRKSRAISQVRAAQMGYARVRGLDAVRRELGTDAAEWLSAVPFDERAGHRLRALALLAAAHRELAERVAGSAELLRQKLGFATRPAAADSPLRPRTTKKRIRPLSRHRTSPRKPS